MHDYLFKEIFILGKRGVTLIIWLWMFRCYVFETW